ncbi:hypothetical protein AA983_06885 [Dermacoccus sp. PE3]|nr:hypothetical protein AA983_06885 [Dermacoccus sp. PE3]
MDMLDDVTRCHCPPLHRMITAVSPTWYGFSENHPPLQSMGTLGPNWATLPWPSVSPCRARALLIELAVHAPAGMADDELVLLDVVDDVELDDDVVVVDVEVDDVELVDELVAWVVPLVVAASVASPPELHAETLSSVAPARAR